MVCFLSRFCYTGIIALSLNVLLTTTSWSQDLSSEGSEITGHIARAQFTSEIIDREPTDILEFITTDAERLYFFTDIRDMEGKTVTHRWLYFGDVVTDINFEVKGPRWRVFSYKTLEESLAGEWSVEIIDQDNVVYSEHAILVAKPKVDPATNLSVPANTTQLTDSVQVTESTTLSNVSRIQTVFPDADYQLVNDTLGGDLCPTSGRFFWTEESSKLWVWDMGESNYIRIHESDSDITGLKPDPALALPDPQCLAYLGNRFNTEHNELIVEIQADCTGSENDIFYARTLTRRDNTIDLTIFDEEYTVCRYKLN